MNWLEDNDVRYIIGLGANNVLKRIMADIVENAAAIQKRAVPGRCHNGGKGECAKKMKKSDLEAEKQQFPGDAAAWRWKN